MLMSVLVSVSIIALLSMISIPYLRQYQANLKINSVSRNLTSDIRYAQQLTITEQVVYKVLLDTIEHKYEIMKTGAATSTIKSISFPPEVRFNQIDAALNNEIVFNSFGGVSQSGQIILINSDGKTAIINVKPSGYIQLAQ
ncbi:MAG: hypothetical protein AAB906_05265 [Patescibacteria group bacterium]